MEENVIYKAKVLFNRIKHSPKLRKEARGFLRSKIRNRLIMRNRQKHLRWARLYGVPNKIVYRRWPGGCWRMR